MDETTVETRKVSITFERKKDLGNYENVVARAWAEDNVPADATDEQVAEALQGLGNAVKAAVYDHLGIEVFLDENGVIREKHAPVVTERRLADTVGTQFNGTSSLRVMNKDYTDPLPAGLVEKCAELGITAVWANKGQYGWFFKEAVSKGEAPKNPDPRDPSKAGIIKF